MAHVLVVTSGKGGVGKTTSTAALGAARRGRRSRRRHRFRRGLRNSISSWEPSGGWSTTISGRALPSSRRFIRDKRIDALLLLAARKRATRTSPKGVERVVGGSGILRLAICDSRLARARRISAMRHADSAIVSPTQRCLWRLDRIIGLLIRPPPGQAREPMEKYSSDAVRPNSGARAARCGGRGCARHSLHSAARDHSRKQGNLARLEHGNTGYLEQSNARSGARLSRRRPQAQRRDGAPGHTERQERTAQQAV